MKSLGSRGEILIKASELLSLKSYKPTPNDVWTIGWGHTGSDVGPNQQITIEEAQALFIKDTAKFVALVNSLSVRLTQSMFDALVSLVFNVGASAVGPKSTIGQALILRDYYSAWAGFTLWRKQRGADGQLHNLLGLARRRAKEMSLFLEDGLP